MHLALRRANASTSSTPTSINSRHNKSSKPKPNKSTNALKRTASASQSIRQYPTPTRGTIQTVFTLSTAERYNLNALNRHLPPSAIMFEEAWWIPSWRHDSDDCEVWLFPNGNLVCWGGGEEAAKAFAEEFLDRDGRIQVGKLDEPESEELDFVTDHTETTRLQGDLIILGHPPQLSGLKMPDLSKHPNPSFPIETGAARYAFSHALARSTSLSALESSLDGYLSSVSTLPLTLNRTGKPGLERKELIMKLGQLLSIRQRLNLTEESFDDTPDFYWAEPALESCFNSVNKTLEIKMRTKLINEKITYAAELQSTLRELLTESSAHRMEVIIIALIAVEVVIALIRDGPELWDAAFGEGDKKHITTTSSEQSVRDQV
ncbi:hypothetical protein FRB96_005658 [Tulasnella sp. 330]|nr:hypothetical protein FRB96_005658 [Tulasnella sp. 330]KAG8877343.1 hypothetical protein FRB97_003531 [Tulasnella sp. 331]KAG8882669.1 hypothetical protein FRB98_003560 [Tulasnella sp. 332]